MTTPTTTRIARAALLPLMLAGALGLSAQDHEHTGDQPPRPESDRVSNIPLDASGGDEIGFVYQAWMSPQQEGGEEEDTPALIPQTFRSTAPSVPRNERPSQGHAVIEFTRDLDRAYVHLAIGNIDPAQIVMLHLHCGRPGQLGPIIVDFGLMGSVPEYLADGTMSIETWRR
jgi:hypothetical protein